MGETDSTSFRTSFNGSLRIEGRPEQLSANAGVLMLREVDQRLGFTEALCHRLQDGRVAARTRHSLLQLTRCRILLLAAGYDQQRDIDHLADDPAFLASLSDRRGTGCIEQRPASQPTLARFQRMLGRPVNLSCLEEGVFDLAQRSVRALGGPGSKELTVDIDSTPLESHGQQPGSCFNGHYRRRCFHPLIATLADTDHILGGKLRPGNEATNKGALEFLLPLLDRTTKEIGPVRWVRGDAGFTSNEFLEALEDRELNYVLRVRNNSRLDKIAEEHLHAPCGPRPKEPREWVVETNYSSKLWPRERRLLLVIQEREDSMYLHHFFLVTNCRETPADWLIQHYRDRGSMEGRLGDFKGAFRPALSCTTQSSEEVDRAEAFAASASTFQLYLMADGLLHTLRLIADEKVSSDNVASPSLRRVRRIIIQVAARVTKSARRLTFVVARSTHELWNELGKRLDRLLPAT